MFFYFLASELLLNKSIPDKFVSDNIQMLTELHIFLLNLLLIRQSILPFLKVSLKYLSSEADILSFATPHEKNMFSFTQWLYHIISDSPFFICSDNSFAESSPSTLGSSHNPLKSPFSGLLCKIILSDTSIKNTAFFQFFSFSFSPSLENLFPVHICAPDRRPPMGNSHKMVLHLEYKSKNLNPSMPD